MKIEQVSMKNRSGGTLRGVLTLPEGSAPAPCVLLLHGFASTITGYKNLNVGLARALAENGIACARFDFYGNGESDGTFADMTFDGLHSDAQDMYAWLAGQPAFCQSRLFLAGQSMGGYLAASLAPQLRPHGLLLLCPGAGMWYGCAQRADAVLRTGQDYADLEGLRYQMEFNYQMARHPDPYTEAAGYSGPVLIARAADDPLVDAETCRRYSRLYSAPRMLELPAGGHNFTTIPARAALAAAMAAFVHDNI